MRYLRLYDYVSEHESDRPHYTENLYSTCYMQKDKVVDYHNDRPEPKMSVQELIDAGYAEIKQDCSEILPGAETGWSIVQIHTNCPVKLENITDFDTWITSATTFVWRESLPNSWDPIALATKYDNVQLARPLMVEMFSQVDMSGVRDLTLSFAGAQWYWPHSSVLSQRYRSVEQGGNTATFKTPQNVTIKIRGEYSSVAQCSFSMLKTTTALTIDCGGVFVPHDVSGLFEGNYKLVTLNLNLFRWDCFSTCHMMFDKDHELTAVPYTNNWARDSVYNTIYPHNNGTRGSSNCGGIFNASGLTYIGPTINMNAVNNVQGGVNIDGNYQAPLPYGTSPMFDCPLLTDVRIINLNNNNWNFADKTTYTYIPAMNVASIEYLLNNVADCTSSPHTVTFKNTYQNQVSSAAINAAAAKGWTVAWQA